MRILFILLLIYLFFQVFFRFILPLVGRYMFHKAVQTMQGEAQGPYRRQAPPRREGEVKIENAGKQSPRFDGDTEDVDFVEVK
jgi:hypothetical protein